MRSGSDDFGVLVKANGYDVVHGSMGTLIKVRRGDAGGLSLLADGGMSMSAYEARNMLSMFRLAVDLTEKLDDAWEDTTDVSLVEVDGFCGPGRCL